MTLFTLIVIFAYLGAIVDGALRLGRFMKEVEDDAMKSLKKK
jgi:hypothetical protein